MCLIFINCLQIYSSIVFLCLRKIVFDFIFLLFRLFVFVCALLIQPKTKVIIIISIIMASKSAIKFWSTSTTNRFQSSIHFSGLLIVCYSILLSSTSSSLGMLKKFYVSNPYCFFSCIFGSSLLLLLKSNKTIDFLVSKHNFNLQVLYIYKFISIKHYDDFRMKSSLLFNNLTNTIISSRMSKLNGHYYYYWRNKHSQYWIIDSAIYDNNQLTSIYILSLTLFFILLKNEAYFQFFFHYYYILYYDWHYHHCNDRLYLAINLSV